MKVRDDRTEEQKKTHTILIVGTDSFMSGWGRATGGVSYAAWACRPEDQNKVESWVRRRGDIKRVRITCDPYSPKGTGDCHIYIVDEKHPAIN